VAAKDYLAGVIPMQDGELVIHGQVTSDGVLTLDAHPGLPVGPVEVVIRPMSPAVPGADNWWQCLQQARAELERAGHRFRSKEEIDADIESLRSGDERIGDVRSLMEQQSRT
jgi:hypothetical protein